MQEPNVKRTIAALVPAHNEEKVIAETLEFLLQSFDRQDIYVVDDGSTDSTVAIARRYTDNVLPLYPNIGKATAMNTVISYYQLADRYEYLLPMDADTKITKNFLDSALGTMHEDTGRKIACVVGKVIGSKHSWVTTYRLWEYEVAQSIHKAAQSEEEAIIVCPGCSTIYRASIFKDIQIPTGTLTEDMDFTFQIHRKKVGTIIYNPDAIVVTQDPLTLRDFLKQIDRWYTGFWQCVVKNNIPWGGQALDMEVAMLGLEGLFNGLLVMSFIFLVPFALIKNPQLLLIPFLYDLFFFLIPTMLFTAKRHEFWTIFRYLPFFLPCQICQLSCFSKKFFQSCFWIRYQNVLE